MKEDLPRESKAERESRFLLNRFLIKTDPLLGRMLQHLVLESAEKAAVFAGHQLSLIWRYARVNLKGVIRTVEIGLSRARRKALKQIGMFGDELAAKWELLSLDIQEGAVKRILKRLNSMLGSLSKVFPALHAAKEFKDHLEATVEGLQDAPEFIELGDLSPER